MVLQFDDLDQIALRVASTDDQPGTLDEIDVGVVDLEAMAVALANGGCLVGTGREGARLERAVIAAQAHGRTFVDHALLVLHHVDDRMRRLGIELHAIGPLQAEDMPRKFDHRDLKAEAQAVVGDLVFSGEPGSRDLALRATITKTARDEDTIEALQERQTALLLKVLGIDAPDVDLAIIGDARMRD